MAGLPVGELYADLYFWDCAQSGLWFKIPAAKRVSGENEDGFLAKCARMKDELERRETDPANQDFKPCCFFNDAMISKFPPDLLDSLGANTYLMLFRDGEKPTGIHVEPWHGFTGDGMIAYHQKKKTPYTVWEVALTYNPDQLRHRFERLPLNPLDNTKPPEEVTAYLKTFGTVTPPPPTEDPNDPPDPVISGGLTMHMLCPHCGKKIF